MLPLLDKKKKKITRTGEAFVISVLLPLLKEKKNQKEKVCFFLSYYNYYVIILNFSVTTMGLNARILAL